MREEEEWPRNYWNELERPREPLVKMETKKKKQSGQTASAACLLNFSYLHTSTVRCV
jgi:hypothetical protein